MVCIGGSPPLFGHRHFLGTDVRICGNIQDRSGPHWPEHWLSVGVLDSYGDGIAAEFVAVGVYYSVRFICTKSGCGGNAVVVRVICII